jgi:hypothetical protein
MSELAQTGYPSRVEAPAGIWEHYCCQPSCKTWGGFGYQEVGGVHWYCGEHRAIAEAARR